MGAFCWRAQGRRNAGGGFDVSWGFCGVGRPEIPNPSPSANSLSSIDKTEEAAAPLNSSPGRGGVGGGAGSAARSLGSGRSRSATSTNSGAHSDPVNEHEKNESPLLHLFCDFCDPII